MASTTIFFFHQKAWAAVITNGNAYWPKTERQNQSYGIQYKPPQSDLEKKKKQEQRDFILIANTIKNAQ